MVHPGTYMKLHMSFNGINQTMLWKAMRINQATLSLLVNGKQSLNAKKALKLEKILGVPAIYWLHWQAEYDLETELKKQNGKSTRS
jgi:addiction module HigA family antidote